jgi:hypothetical protein
MSVTDFDKLVNILIANFHGLRASGIKAASVRQVVEAGYDSDDFHWKNCDKKFRPNRTFRAVFGKLEKQPEKPFQLFFRRPG